MADEDIVINVEVKGLNNLSSLSSGLRNITADLQKGAQLTKNMDAHQRALNSALGMTSKGIGEHAKNLRGLATNQAILSQEFKRTQSEIKKLKEIQTAINTTMNKSNSAVRNATVGLEKYSKTLKGVKARVLVEDLKSVALEMRRLGKDAQFTGHSLIVGLTTPLVTFGRMALASLVAVDRELVRLNKVIEYAAPTLEAAATKMGISVNSMTNSQRIAAEKMVSEFKKLDTALIDISKSLGVSRELITGIAGDFAELGVSASDTIITLSRLTAEAEKLGNLDIGASRAFIQSMYQQANRAISVNASSMGKVISAQQREAKATAAVTAQLAMFNAIENVTALNLKDLADAFPEVAAASTSFGLSMTESAALLAPMVAAGFEVGASANSIKVSLQRLNDPTKQNMEMINSLARIMGGEFINATHLGIDSVDYLAQAFSKMEKSGYGAEGALEFMSNLFGVRQGPRMEVAIQQLAQFNDALQQTGKSAESQLAGVANKIIASSIASDQVRVPIIRTFSDIGKIARIASADVGQEIEIIDAFGKKVTIAVTQKDIDAAKAARKAVGDQILQARKEGQDLLGKITTEAGRAMFVELAGAESAQVIAQQELSAALGSLDTQIQKIKINFKLFAADFVKALSPMLSTISSLVEKFADFFTGLSPATKKFVATIAVAVASIGPLVFAFGQARLAIGTVANTLLKFLPGLSHLTTESLAAAPMLLRLNNPVTMVGNSFQTSASRLHVFIATLASMPGPIGAVARKIGTLTNVLNSNITAEANVINSITAMSKGSGRLLGFADQVGITAMSPAAQAAQMFETGAAQAISAASLKNAPAMGFQQQIDDILASIAQTTATAPVVQQSAVAVSDAISDVVASAGTAATASLDEVKKAVFGGPLALPAAPTMLALPAAGETSIASKWGAVTRGQVFGPETGSPERFIERMQTAIPLGGVGSTGVMPSIPVPESPLKFATEAVKAGNLENIASKEFQTAMDTAYTRGAKKAIIDANKANAAAYSAAKKAKKAALREVIKSSVSAELEGPMVPGPAEPTPFTPFNRKKGSFISQLFGAGAGDIGGAPAGNTRRFVDQAIGAEQARMTGSRKFLRGALREGPAAQFMPPRISGAIQRMLPYDEEVTTGFLQRKYTGSRLIDRTRAQLPKIRSTAKGIAEKAGKGLSSIFTSTIEFSKKGFSSLGTAISNAFSSGLKGATSALTSFKSTAFSSFNSIKTHSVSGLKNIGEKISEVFSKAQESKVGQFAINMKDKFISFASNSSKGILKLGTTFKGLKGMMMASGILALVLAITAGIIWFVKNLKSINKAGGDVGKKLGEAFRIVKETASAMFQPFKDAIGTLVKLMGNGKGTGKTMGNIADKIKDIAQKISDFVNKYIVPAIKAAINIAMDIISSVVNFVKAVIAAFKGKWGDMAKYLVKAIAFAVKAIINLFFKTNEVVLSIFFELGNKILDFFASILAGILKGVKKLAGYIGLGSLIPDSWIDALNDVKKPLEGIKNTAIGVMEGVRKTAVNAIDSLANIKSIQIEPGAGDDLIDFGKEKGRELAEVITDPIGESLDNLGGEMGNLVKDIKQKFVDKLLDSVHSKLSEAVDQLTNALEKQKDSALEVFNTQIYALEQLEKAEESLTREQAYQTDRRRMIQERELQILNYQRNRALAIYEGRIDDARMLTLQEQSDNNSYNENIQKLDTDRRKELAQENLNALKDSIQKAQEEASKFYDKQIEDFRNAAAEITKFPPLTIEEYRSQLGQLNDAAKEIAGENGDVLKQMMTDMKDKLRMPNDNVGIFTTGIDSLVSVAKDKYGLLDNTDQNTIIGATIGMIAGISGQFEGSRESIASAFSGIVSDVFDVSTGFTNIATDIVTPTLDAIEQIFITHNPFDVFEQAIRDANTTIVREMYATVGTIGSLVDVLSTRVDQSIVRLAVLNAIASQTSTSAGGSSTDGEAYVTAHTSGGAYYQMGVTSGRLYSVGPGGARVQVRGSIDREILDQLTSMRESITSSQYTQPAFFGGRIAKFANGGFAVPGFPSQGVPALLHGGEYVINANAVRNIGYRTLESLNNMRFNTPSGSSPQVTSSSSTNTTNIYVENFIGQDEWFNNMIKQYNMNVLPKNQKNAGMESRVLTSYNGMTRGA